MSENATAYRARRHGPGTAQRESGGLFKARRHVPGTGPECRASAIRERPAARYRAGSGGGEKKPEAVLHAAWRRAIHSRLVVAGRDGRTYTVIYPGRPGGSSGPDFKDAVLERDDGLRLHGDIEIHVRASGWRAHGHQRDSRYNGVMFHVVGHEGPAAETLTDSGMPVPLLLLKSPERGLTRPSEPDVSPARVHIPFTSLREAGLQWFRNRVEGLRLRMDSFGADQTLFEAALETLGYPANKKGFRDLARRAPWPVALETARGHDAGWLACFFLYAAGFGDAPGQAPALRGVRPRWNRSNGRPANHPRRRARAVAAWTQRWSRSGGPAASFRLAVERARAPGELVAEFLCGPAAGRRGSAVGPDRARDAVVNVMLPGTVALASARGDRLLARKAFRLYLEHRRLPGNALTRAAEEMLEGSPLPGRAETACEQQGLIHIYRTATQSPAPGQQLPLIGHGSVAPSPRLQAEKKR